MTPRYPQDEGKCANERKWYRTKAAVPMGRSQFSFCVLRAGHSGACRDSHGREWEA